MREKGDITGDGTCVIVEYTWLFRICQLSKTYFNLSYYIRRETKLAYVMKY